MKIDITDRYINFDCTNKRGKTNTELNINRTSLYYVDINITNLFVCKVLPISYN
jgi:hypothetical protein